MLQGKQKNDNRDQSEEALNQVHYDLSPHDPVTDYRGRASMRTRPIRGIHKSVGYERLGSVSVGLRAV